MAKVQVEQAQRIVRIEIDMEVLGDVDLQAYNEAVGRLVGWAYNPGDEMYRFDRVAITNDGEHDLVAVFTNSKEGDIPLHERKDKYVIGAIYHERTVDKEDRRIIQASYSYHS